MGARSPSDGEGRGIEAVVFQNWIVRMKGFGAGSKLPGPRDRAAGGGAGTAA